MFNSFIPQYPSKMANSSILNTPQQSVVPQPTQQQPTAPTVDTTFLDKKNYWADIFSQYAMGKTTTDDIDQELDRLTNKKITSYVDTMKYLKSKWEKPTPAQVKTISDSINSDIAYQAKLLEKEKATRLQTAEKQWAIDYQTLSSQYLNTKKQLTDIDSQIQQESTKPVSDPVSIQNLLTQKQQIQKNMDQVTKEFQKRWVNDPWTIVRQDDQMQSDIQMLAGKWATKDEIQWYLATKYPDQELRVRELTAGNMWAWQNIDNLLYKVWLWQYDDAQWEFDAKTFIKDTQSIPEYAWLPKEQLATKLLEREDDPEVIKDMIFVTSKLGGNYGNSIKVLQKKWFDNADVATAMIAWYLDNVSKPDAWTFNSILKSLKDNLNWIQRSDINDILDQYWVSMNRSREVETD